VKAYCDVCGKEVEARRITKKETYSVCGEAVEVDAQVQVCPECGEELFCEELDQNTLLAAYNIYRKRHKLLLPEEIRKIREQYGLSQRAFARLLNWGDKTVFRYENGSIQDKAHNSLLLFLQDPENMRTYLNENEVDLSEKERSRLLRTVDLLEQNRAADTGNRLFHLYFASQPSEENGFRSFDYDKFCAMVLFFATKSGELLKTKLMKLLNYSDMVYFKENGISISGARYAHLPFGPVPEKFDWILGKMETDHIAHVEIFYDNGYEKHEIVADEEMPAGILSEKEIEVLDRIYSKFEAYGSRDMSNYSHKEKGYQETKQGEIIPYSYAKYIEIG
jgi:putative zinc finger/helix-turn-helix YgiT family protein